MAGYKGGAGGGAGGDDHFDERSKYNWGGWAAQGNAALPKKWGTMGDGIVADATSTQLGPDLDGIFFRQQSLSTNTVATGIRGDVDIALWAEQPRFRAKFGHEVVDGRGFAGLSGDSASFDGSFRSDPNEPHVGFQFDTLDRSDTTWMVSRKTNAGSQVLDDTGVDIDIDTLFAEVERTAAGVVVVTLYSAALVALFQETYSTDIPLGTDPLIPEVGFLNPSGVVKRIRQYNGTIRTKGQVP